MKPKPDNRPRFGWTQTLDNEPQIIRENKTEQAAIPVVVIPLPFESPTLRRKIRDFVNGTIWPEQD